MLSTDSYTDLFSPTVTCPLGGVAEVMRGNDVGRGVLVCAPDETLEAIIPRLSEVTGLPVISKTGRVCGVISRKDIIRVRKASGSLQDLVSKHMTCPAVTIQSTAAVQDAADLMLRLKIRRLPVVDENSLPIGILSRSDIFKPLFLDQYTEYMSNEVAAVQGLARQLAGIVPAQGAAGALAVNVADAVAAPPATPKKAKKIKWKVKYLYDGECAMCMSLKTVLKRQDRERGLIKFVNIAEDTYNPSKNMGITYEEAMETIHVIRPDGEVIYGTDALRAMFKEVGLSWAADLSAWPFVSKLVDLIYHFLSSNRISLGGAFDAIIAAKRVEMSKKGVESCGDLDEECSVEW
eukprot:CAMPEP_0119107482 /NCGR_PEP_ID=MMETSP1180-20130426/10462_1 /TAXON_ID=3052 ORGANISM="Chlamydomonas cf sp, Strain CCMP681" /NCGR_SAMPLE_ID=MMETSP1180 /ASSEMBLY_ACC=CAM_ASM_000741 /LENGTH=348 /DNA_ID=CAMNT_0007092977 /DNA_START=181 /DNA_END=1224 /DNA_ORIENTATION=-